jgi:nitrate/nitrite-specific signal transduction histidine kinase
MLAVGGMTEAAAHVALHGDRETVIYDAVVTARRAVGADSAMAAVANDAGSYEMRVLDGVREPRFREMVIRRGLGLGGQVLTEGRSRCVDDYATESTISADFKPIVALEDLHSIGCVPVLGPNGIDVLLYVSRHVNGGPDGRAMADLERVASYASIGLHHIAARARERELAILRERQRLAAELHDSVAQSLFAIGIAAQHSREAQDPAIVMAQLEAIEATAANARFELRETLARLGRAPQGLAFETLFEAELRLFERRTGRRVWITRQGEPRDLGPACGELLLDSVREGLTNAAKHGQGRIVLAHLAYYAERVLLSLQTELEPPPAGRGRCAAIVPGSGLSLLRERTERIGGTLELAFDDDVAVLRVELPA